MKKRLLAVLLMAVMSICVFAVCAFAEDGTEAAAGTPAAELTAVAEAGSLTATVKWTVTPDDGFTYKVTPTVNSKKKAAVELEAGSTEYTLEGLKADDQVKFRVDVLDGETVVASQDTNSVDVLPAPPEVAMKVKATAGSFMATASWTITKDGEPSDEYIFTVTPFVNDEELTTVKNGYEMDYTLKKLKKGDVVYFVVRAYENGEYEKANRVRTKTTAEVEVLGMGTPEVTAYSSYNGVALEWGNVPGASRFEVYMDGKRVAKNAKKRAYDNKKKWAYVVNKIGDDKTHTFYVRAISADGDKAKSNVVKKTRVRQMYIDITISRNRTLTSHDRAHKTRTIKGGTRVRAFGFGRGQYKFYYKGNLYHVTYLTTRGAKAIYRKGGENWSRKEAEYFINNTGEKSATKYYIWVNQYCQHAYAFQGKKGSWKCIDDWEVSTGAAATPSPTGFGKKIFRKVRSHNGHGPWTSFQSWTSFHDSKKSWQKLWGSPVSHACIRCPNRVAWWIYKSVPMRTGVGVY